MAAVVRLQSLQGLRKASTSVISRRAINSSSKKCESKIPEITFAPPPKTNWVSYGFDYKDKTIDRNVTKNTLFMTITVMMVFGGFLLSYLPDPQLRDWTQREAYLEIRRREELGLPHIDCNLVNPANIVLPTDEELGDTEIII
ncbi:NADH dehydrogenase [ubiquinone] 1 beta subcomplex subunit 11, mitochondrial [Athalia rosae]|uniref:NADH dehydrogenase [ubiquinone] 1 beta subcomplex subunit 11, mitochondrial n=1 Tax=Athalia rosae TaxID=37344 RepID=UPI0020339BCD|nr:NADH dehydrogenase [ubiquinone] 1 beta subcomplex subunit 11, mitochondrial [Athalia rosae]